MEGSAFSARASDLGCIETKICKYICVGKLSPRSKKCTPLHRFLSSHLFLKISEKIANFLPNFARFNKFSLEFVDFRADFYRNFTKSCRLNKNYQIFAENCEALRVKTNCENL